MELVQSTPGHGCRDGAQVALVVDKDNRQEAWRRLLGLCPDLPEQSCVTHPCSEGPLWMVMRVPPQVPSTCALGRLSVARGRDVEMTGLHDQD